MELVELCVLIMTVVEGIVVVFVEVVLVEVVLVEVVLVEVIFDVVVVTVVVVVVVVVVVAIVELKIGTVFGITVVIISVGCSNTVVEGIRIVVEKSLFSGVVVVVFVIAGDVKGSNYILIF